MDPAPVIVCGQGRVGARVALFLESIGVPVVRVDRNLDLADPSFAGKTAVKGDCRLPEVLRQAGASGARGAVVATSDDLTNVACALAFRRLNPAGRLVVRMFNPTLVSKLAGGASDQTVALSVSALTAPLLAMSALTGEALAAFQADSKPMQLAEIDASNAGLVGRSLADVAGQYQVLVVAHRPADAPVRLFAQIQGRDRLQAGDAVTVCGAPTSLGKLQASGGDPLSAVYWAGSIRRLGRTAWRALAGIDLPVKLGFLALFGTLLVSTLVFKFALGTSLAGGLLQTVRAVATQADLGEHRDWPDWAKVFLSGLKLTGAALLAAFTAILTQYLVRAKLGGALELRRIPESGHVVVCGLGNVGYRTVEELVRLGRPVVAIDRDPQGAFVTTVRRLGVAVIHADATVPAVLAQARASDALAVVAATSSDLANLEIALLARELPGKPRAVVRVTDPNLADAIKTASGLPLAIGVADLAAPAFAAALFGDRVQTLIPFAGRTLAAVELVVQAGDACLDGVPLGVAMADYEFLPVALGGRPDFTADGIPRAARLVPGDRLTVLLELARLERILKREPAPAAWSVEVRQVPAIAGAAVVPLIRTTLGCDQLEAERLAVGGPFVLAKKLTRGAAEELAGRLMRERVEVLVVPA